MAKQFNTAPPTTSNVASHGRNECREDRASRRSGSSSRRESWAFIKHLLGLNPGYKEVKGGGEGGEGQVEGSEEEGITTSDEEGASSAP